MPVAHPPPPPPSPRSLRLPRCCCCRTPTPSQERACVGTYQPDSPHPDYCNALATSLWEFDLLRHHFHPHVAAQAKELLKGSAIVLSQYEAPFRFITASDHGADGELKPPMTLPKPRKKSSTYLVLPITGKTRFVQDMEVKTKFVGRRDKSIVKMRAAHGDD